MNLRRASRTLPVLVLALAALYTAARLGISDIHYSRAGTELNFWSRQDYRPGAARVNATRQEIDAALRFWPGNPDYLEARARLLMWQAYWETSEAVPDSLARDVVAARLQAVQRRPARRQGWYDLAADQARLGQNDAGWRLAIERINALGAAQD